MESKEEHGQLHPHPDSELPGRVTQDTTNITPVKFSESGTAENEVRRFFEFL
jgi:hypothetical protein